MSNIKQFTMEGWLPFDLGDDEVALVIGRLHAPSINVTWTWGEEQIWGPNVYDGQPAMYHYRVDGQEGYSSAAFEMWAKLFSKWGPVEVLTWTDIEAREGPFDYRKTLTDVDWDAWKAAFKVPNPQKKGTLMDMLISRGSTE